MSNPSGSASDSASPSSISSTTTTTTTTSSTTTTSASLPPSNPVSSSLPPSDSASLPPSSSISSSSSLPVSTSSPPPSSTSTTSASTTHILSFSTNSNGGVVTFTQTQTQTQSGATPTASGEVRAATKSFLQNKGAVAAVFTIVGLVAAGILFALVTGAIRRRKAKRFDREIAEEAKRAPAPVFVDDDDYNDGGYSSAYGSGGGYHDGAYGAAVGAHDNYAVAADPYAAGHGPSSDGYPASDAVHSGGTPSNYMYPSGYSDLGFSDVSSHGTFAQPPMDAYGHGAGYGAGVGAAGAYEMMGYVPHTGQDWHNQGGQGAQGGYVYPGEDPHNPAQGGYPPTATTAHSSGSDVLGRSKSGARSLVDSYNTPPSEGASGKGVNVQQPQYADGYVSHYQNQGHLVEDGAYGGMESHHGHIVGEDDEESEGEGDGRRVLKVANE